MASIQKLIVVHGYQITGLLSNSSAPNNTEKLKILTNTAVFL